jgi:hypothetical protein
VTSLHCSVAITGGTDTELRAHLERSDGQEDLCFATWRWSTGRRRQTALLVEPIFPEAGERHVHGNASFESRYALRAAKIAAQRDEGLVFLHAHPHGSGWQPLNDTDAQAEASIANLARELTGLSLVGMTLGCADHSWSARIWDRGAGREVASRPGESVRVVSD